MSWEPAKDKGGHESFSPAGTRDHNVMHSWVSTHRWFRGRFQELPCIPLEPNTNELLTLIRGLSLDTVTQCCALYVQWTHTSINVLFYFLLTEEEKTQYRIQVQWHQQTQTPPSKRASSEWRDGKRRTLISCPWLPAGRYNGQKSGKISSFSYFFRRKCQRKSSFYEYSLRW